MSSPVWKARDLELIGIDQEQFNAMAALMAKHPSELFLSPLCRQYLARNRFERRKHEVDVFAQPSTGVMPGTVSHNLNDLTTFNSSKRSLRLINPLMSIEGVYEAPHELDVLSIGPRTEMELIHLVGAGFLPRNVKSLDLISTSPWIEAGDMHALPYPDRSFDVVISSWVLAYSTTPQVAVNEILRVVRDGGLVAMGATYNPDYKTGGDYEDPAKKIVGTVFRSVSQFQEMLGSKLVRVHFQDEPESDAKGPVTLIGRIRHGV